MENKKQKQKDLYLAEKKVIINKSRKIFSAY